MQTVSCKIYFSSWIKVKLDLLTDIDMLFMVEKGIRRRSVTLIIDMQKLITNT